MKRIFYLTLLLLLCGYTLYAADVVVTMNLVSPNGLTKAIGTITASDTKYGLVLSPNLTDLPPGLHGFHVHENANCEPGKKDDKLTAAQAAGGHLDPDKTGKHEGPEGEGHLGDLPGLFVGNDHKATSPVLAPRLKTSDLAGHSLMIHAGSDNYSDQPLPLGGGGERIACGVVK